MSASTKNSLQTLSDFVTVRPRFTRSVHLERDWSASRETTGYHLTPSAHELLKIIAGAPQRPADRALTVVGPYGAGKSAFCVFLAGLVSGGKDENQALRERDATLAKDWNCTKRRLLPVPIVGAREPLARALVKGLLHALEAQDANMVVALRREWNEVLDKSTPAPREVADLYESAAGLAAKNGFEGLLLLADELGKFLEYAALHPADGDIFTLQELAEAAARSKAPLFVVAVLHQNADAYAQKLGRAHQMEWAKVGERFREVPFFPSDTERMDMVGYALEHAPQLHLNGSFGKLAARGVELLPKGVAERFPAMARAAYPLHPLVLMALPALFRKTGQSHRSLFNFLSGEEAHALGRFIRENNYSPEAPPLFMLDALFDYASEVLLGGWSAGTLARLWAEAVEAVDRALQISETARRVLKCIALLSLLRDPHLPASLDTLKWALTEADGTSPDVKAALEELSQGHFIVYSRLRQVYRLWEGGDLDIEDALETARSGLPLGVTLRAATERDLCPMPRLIARRYSYETGTLRTVETWPCSVGQLESFLGDQESLAVVLCLAENADEAERAEAIARSTGRVNVLVAVARETEILREAALDVAAAGEVAKNPALDGDNAARRELEARRFEAENAFRDEWSRLFDAPSSRPRWFHNGESVNFETGRDFSAFLSKMADDTYPATPVLRNELINRHTLSSAAAAGRRALIEAMLKNAAEPSLGIEKFPPELSMYECLLRASGLHREMEPGRWGFTSPDADDPAHLGPAWGALENAIFAEQPKPLALTQLFAILSGRPYGLSAGVLPVLLCAFLLTHADETTLYKDGTFIAEPSVADWEILLRRPELFAVAGCQVEGARAAVVERLAQGFGVEGQVVPVVRALLQNCGRLPEYSWKTRHLPETTLAMRAAIERAQSPEQLLFGDLPDALELKGLLAGSKNKVSANAEQFFVALNAALQAWNRALPAAVESARDELLQACGFAAGAAQWKQLRAAAVSLQGQVANADLAPFVHRAAMTGDEVTQLDSVLALVAGRPPRSWTDSNADRFPAQARAIGQLFQQARRVGDETLTEAEKKASEKLVFQLQKQLQSKFAAESPRVQRDALRQLLSALEETAPR